MRASDLLGVEVVDERGERIGRVMGIRCVQDGPVLGAMAAPRVEALVVHRRRMGAMLGYQLRDQGGPRLIGALMDWVHRDTRLVPWERVREEGGGAARRLVVLG